jgi:thiol-disulfide isomerase/thioredoxin
MILHMRNLAVGLLVLASCSSAEDKEYAAAAPASVERTDGVRYPTDALGSKPRQNGKRGDRMANLAFWGYPNGDTTEQLSSLSLSRFYAPARKPEDLAGRLLHLVVVAGWCPVCRGEARALTAKEAELGAGGAVFLTVMLQGSKQGVGPSLLDLAAWSSAHPRTSALLLDMRGQTLAGAGFDIEGVPWNALVDTRTMEILSTVTGAPKDVAAWVNSGLAWVAENPPSYE